MFAFTLTPAVDFSSVESGNGGRRSLGEGGPRISRADRLSLPASWRGASR